MYVYKYIYIYAYTYMYAYIYIYIYLFICFLRIYIYIRVYIYYYDSVLTTGYELIICMYRCIYIYIYCNVIYIAPFLRSLGQESKHPSALPTARQLDVRLSPSPQSPDVKLPGYFTSARYIESICTSLP